MQARKSEKSNVELPAFRITGTDPVSRKNRKFFIVIGLIAASLLPAVRAREVNYSKPEQSSATPKAVVNAAPAAPTVRTASGIVRGVTEDDVSSFKGIPFAAPPVGENRWRPPQPFPAWEGERDASKFGPDCAQPAFRPGTISMSPTSSEDCLFVNLWRPASAASGAKLPVMVWIYGGGFMGGSSAAPNTSGTQFAKQGVVLVAANYRVGRFGFFAFP